MKIDLAVPASWKDVTLEQLYIIAPLVGDKVLGREEILFVLFCRFAGLKHVRHGVFVTNEGNTIRLETWQLTDFCNRLSFVLDERPVDIVNPTSINPYLDNVTFGNYFHADSLMYGYMLKKDAKMVKKALVDLGEQKKRMPAHFADAVWLWWCGVQGWLKSQYPAVFEEKGASSEAYDPLRARQNIMLMLNNNSPQDNKKIEESLMHDVLSALQDKLEKERRNEEYLKKNMK